MYSNSVVDGLLDQVSASTDWDTQMALIKEVAVIVLGDAQNIPIGATPAGHWWWPWVKNHYGEFTLADGAFSELIMYIWLDQDLKEDMGY